MNYFKELFKKYKTEIFMLTPAFFFLLGFLVIIFYYLITLSLTYVESDYTEKFPAILNYQKVLGTSEFKSALMHTFVFVLIGTPLELIVGLLLAVLVYRKFKFRGIVRGFFIIPLAVPAMVTAIILSILFDFPGGHINSLLMGKYDIFPQIINTPIKWRSSAAMSLGLCLLGKVWRDMPISMLILLAGLNSITRDQYAAAETLGARERDKFRFITIPLLLPSISTVLLIRSIEMWKEFIFPYFLARRYRLLGTLIEELYHDWHKTGEAAAVAVVLVLCIILSAFMVMFVLKWLKSSLIRI